MTLNLSLSKARLEVETALWRFLGVDLAAMSASADDLVSAFDSGEYEHLFSGASHASATPVVQSQQQRQKQSNGLSPNLGGDRTPSPLATDVEVKRYVD